SWSVGYLKRAWGVAPLMLLRPFAAPVLAVALMVAFTLGARVLPFGSEAWARIAAAAVATGLAYAGLGLWGRDF
ncbi:MAG: lipopolysaccharide biosynthesis protein, partial [Rhodospirillales bacterium]|nr:lipopolysaccharide biosynthesis protein [Rhodospirillales bacterium]